MSHSAMELLIIFLLLVANGAFAMAEIAIVSARKARLQHMAEGGNHRARIALGLANQPNQFLAAVQIGITLVGILAGAFGGATLAEQIAVALDGIEFIAPYGEAVGVGIVVLGITYCSLVIGELVPKRLALNNPERIAAALAVPMRKLAAITAPVVWLLNASSDLIIRLLGIKATTEPSITPEEIKLLIRQGTLSGTFEASEQTMIDGILRLDQRQVGAFMTPHTRIVWLDTADSPEGIHHKIATTRFSRFPVARGGLDHILGFVRARDLLNQCLSGQPIDLGAALHQPLFVPESMTALQVLELFQQSGSHLALIVDEYGGIQGLLTHNDLLEDISGYAATGSPAPPPVVRRADGAWLIDGLLPIDELRDILGIDKLPDDHEGNYLTVGGFVLARLGGIPAVGHHFVWKQLRFEVAAMDGRRVDKVLVTSLK